METFYRFTLNAMSEGYRKRVELMNWLRPCLGAMTLRRMLTIVAVKLWGSMHEVALCEFQCARDFGGNRENDIL